MLIYYKKEREKKVGKNSQKVLKNSQKRLKKLSKLLENSQKRDFKSILRQIYS